MCEHVQKNCNVSSSIRKFLPPTGTVLRGCMTRAGEVTFPGHHELPIAEKLSAVSENLPVSLLPFTYDKSA